jgi:multicomponent Na+:H+ antiporter subunit B
LEFLIDIALLGLLVATTLSVLVVRNLFVASMLLGIVSFIMAVIFVSLDAVDVAFTEAAVGAGISTILFIGTLALVGYREKDGSAFALGPALASLVVGAALLYATAEMPEFGNPNNPAQTHVAPRYIETSPTEIGLPNMVTSVLASYRGYDTFGETTVIFTAGIGVIMVLTQRRRRRPTKNKTEDIESLSHALIPHVVGKLLIPFVMLFGLYVQFHGDFGPGGGFQAGVIFAAGFILYALVFGLTITRQVLPPAIMRFTIALGVLVYGGVGIVSLFRGGNFLDYNVLAATPVGGQHIGILLVELGVGITVAAAMIAIFYSFVGRPEFTDSEED